MSVLSQKTDLYDKVAVLKTSNELNTNESNANLQVFSPFESSFTKNNTDPFLFIIDLLSIISGSDAVSRILNQIFSGLDSIEISFKNKLKMEFAASAGGAKNTAQIPPNVQSGVNLHVNKIDYYGCLFTDDTTPEYDLYNDDFSQSLTQNIKNPGTTTQLSSSINSNYNNTTGYYTFTPTSNSGAFTTFIDGLIDSIPFIDSKVLLATTLDMIFNTSNKSPEQIELAVQIDTILNKFVTQVEQDNSYFTFDTEDLAAIQTQVTLSSQLYTDIGCRRVAVSLETSDITNALSGMTYPISSKVIAQTITNVSNTVANSNSPDLLPGDGQSVSNNFLSTLLNALKANLIRKFFCSPQINIIYAIATAISTSSNLFDPIGDIQNRKNLTDCMMKQLVNDLISDIYQLVEKEIAQLVAEVAIIYIEEAFDKYKKILISL